MQCKEDTIHHLRYGKSPDPVLFLCLKTHTHNRQINKYMQNHWALLVCNLTRRERGRARERERARQSKRSSQSIKSNAVKRLDKDRSPNNSDDK